ncbi:MAG: response regulator transcription factor [Pyrinomonadaceae bacterium]
MPSPIRILVVEYESLTRLGMQALIEASEGLSLAGDADNLADGLNLFRELAPDVTILGLRFPDSCSIDDLDKYFAESPNARIIVLAGHAGDVEISRALSKGVAGYICKDIEPTELIEAIRTVATGRKYLPNEIAQILSENVGQEALTAAESNILRMIVGGMSNKEIGFALGITENTVKTHNQNLFGKIGVSDRTSAAAIAIRRGLVRIDL